MYMGQPNLTMDNIEDVISLSKQSLADECLSACELFLKSSLTIDTMFHTYRLALLYDINNLKSTCEDEICVFAGKVLQSSSFLEFPYEYLQMVLQRDALACDEVDIFNACMAWAKVACKRHNLNPSIGKFLRDQLRDLMYQFRFTSMTKEEASDCIRLNPGLFTADELEEIICMVSLQDKFQPKKFNWTPRYFNLNWYKGRRLELNRVEKYNPYSTRTTAVNKSETTRFSCNRRVLLKSFHCQVDSSIKLPMRVVIKESRNNENVIDRYDQKLRVHFNVRTSQDDDQMYQAEIVLDKSILLRPKYDYDISIEFDNIGFERPHHHCIFATKKRIDHDIVFNFKQNGIISGFSIYRFDNKNYFQKVFYNPKTWIVLVGGVASVFLSIFINSYFQSENLTPMPVDPIPELIKDQALRKSFSDHFFQLAEKIKSLIKIIFFCAY